MQAGRLNEIIIIQRQNYKQSESGSQKVMEWVDYKRTRSAVRYESGIRTDDNNELFFGSSVNFEIRIYHDIRELDRIIWRGKKYRILNIEEQRDVARLVIKTSLINE